MGRKQNRSARHSARHTIFNEIKLSRGCQNPTCQWMGILGPPMLHFHHVDENEKDFSIGQRNRCLPSGKIIRELEKCSVLCGNCHALHHYVVPLVDLVPLVLTMKEVSAIKASDG